MGTVSKPYTFTAGNVIFSAQVNSDFDTLYTLVNGNIDNNNINAGAAIDWTKLATTISRNLAFATTYGISTDFTMANNWINQFNQALPSPMAGTARMVQAYNTSLVAGVWAGRTVTAECIAYITTVANVFEIWYAPSAATPAVPVWTKVYSLNLATGLLNTNLDISTVNARAAASNNQIISDFAFPSTGTSLPSGWAATYTNATDVTYTDQTGAGAGTITNSANTGGRPPCIFRGERFYNTATGRTYYFYTEAEVIVQAGLLNNALKVGWGDSTGFITPNINLISVYFGIDLNLYLRVRQASVNFDTLLQAYAVGTRYQILIIWTTATSIAVYINGILKTTYTTTANFPSVVMNPVISGLTQDGSNSAGSWGFSTTVIGRI